MALSTGAIIGIIIGIVLVVIIVIVVVLLATKNKNLLEDNEPCTSNSECETGACARDSAAPNATLICCPNGDSSLYAGYAYCRQRPTGTVCWSDTACASGNCRGNLGGIQRGVCT